MIVNFMPLACYFLRIIHICGAKLRIGRRHGLSLRREENREPRAENRDLIAGHTESGTECVWPEQVTIDYSPSEQSFRETRNENRDGITLIVNRQSSVVRKAGMRDHRSEDRSILSPHRLLITHYSPRTPRSCWENFHSLFTIDYSPRGSSFSEPGNKQDRPHREP